MSIYCLAMNFKCNIYISKVSKLFSNFHKMSPIMLVYALLVTHKKGFAIA